MAKQTRQVKGVNIVAEQGKGSSFEHHESIDDSLLPDALELGKLKELDENILDWIKERTAKEQDNRLDYNHRKMALVENNHSRLFILDIVSILAAFLIIIAGMVFSYFLLINHQIITSTIFAGATIVFSATAFLNFRKKNNTPDPKSK